MTPPATFRQYFRLGQFKTKPRRYRGIAFEYIPSWDTPYYRKFGSWWHEKREGMTLRYRGWLLLVWWR